ncbi:Gfo/Idh/MocA family oxidoreductase, partial [candidate division KSB1 bacterium]|nr:Gfo/Idh/MocA family oxidoreductase [candidate division KSB1 bacterium]
MKQQKNDYSRRNFLGTVAAAGAVMVACNGNKINTSNMPSFLDQAPDGKELKAGLIGCGGRGTGAALNFLDAGPNLKIVALADVFNDRLQSCKERLAERANNEVPEENCFIGFDAYQKLVALSELDIVLIATPPHFRPAQFEAAVNAKKHIFMEKPVAVDPPGARSIMANAKKAEQLGL